MAKRGFTTLDLKMVNKSNVYHFIYKKGTTSKLQIAQDLQLGISTVSQNIKILQEENFIEKGGHFDSTGGRKADMLQIVASARVAIGVGILLDAIFIVAVDLYGKILCSKTINLSYQSSQSYAQFLGANIQTFIQESLPTETHILGVSIAIQGITSSDGQSIKYGEILKNTELKLSQLSPYIPYPCRLNHDCKSAAFYELWNHKEVENGVMILLNRNLGGALLMGGKVYEGMNQHGGVLEHMCVSKDGPFCYCGNRGCLETYCSANALENAANVPIVTFFAELRKGHIKYKAIWQDYLNKLAFGIHNLNVLIDGHIIISGYLAPFLIEDDLLYLLDVVNASPFPIKKEQLILGTYGQYTPAAGAALAYVSEFLKSL